MLRSNGQNVAARSERLFGLCLFTRPKAQFGSRGIEQRFSKGHTYLLAGAWFDTLRPRCYSSDAARPVRARSKGDPNKMATFVPLAWRRDPAPAPRLLNSLAQQLGMTEIAAEILIRRGYDNAGAARAFLNPSSAQSHDPLQMRGMREARDRVRAAVQNKERILIYGDYDADGIPGTALLYLFLSNNKAVVSTMIAFREGGYGLTAESVDRILASPDKPGLVITVDCGTSDHDSIRRLQDAGIEVVVTDHHLAIKGNPPTPYYINPNRADHESYPFKGLCGCGVAYKLVQALAGGHVPAFFDLVTVSTIGDCVPLINENRWFVKQGLERLRSSAQGNIGLREINRVSQIAFQSISGSDIGFRIAPRINAVGRMGKDPNLAVELLTTSNHGRARELAGWTSNLNSQRQEATDELTATALRQIGARPADFIVAYLPESSVGVAGLVASRIVEATRRPALVVNAKGSGSGRAPSGINLVDYLQQLRSRGVFGQPRRNSEGKTVVPEFGGHTAACGFHDVNPSALQSAASGLRLPRNHRPELEVDGEITIADITPRLSAELDRIGPYGTGHTEPSLVLQNVILSDQRATSERHVHLQVRDDSGAQVKAVFYNGSPVVAEMGLKNGMRVDLVGQPDTSARDGTVFLVRSARPAQPFK